MQRGRTLRERVLSCLEELGGLQSLVPPGQTVLLKPNLVMDRPHSSGAITNPALLDILLDALLRQASPREVIVGEGAAAHCSTEKAFSVSGVDKIAQKYGVRLVDLQKDNYVQVSVPRGKALKQVEVARTVLEADCLINLPVLKMHCQTQVTIGLKNLKGCISDREKKRFHSLELEQCIADLNTVLSVQLVVVDATLGSFAWEGGGDPVRLDTVLAGTNQVSVDAVAASLLGYHPGEIEHIRLSEAHGLGTARREQIQVLHPEKLQGISFPAEFRCGVQYRVPGLQVVEKGTCTPCLASFLAATRRLEKERIYLPGTAYLGQRLTEADLETLGGQGKGLGIGNCGARLVGQEEAVWGCPPEGWQVYNFLKGMVR